MSYINIKFLLALYKEGARYVFLPSQTRVTSNKHLVHWTATFYKINAPTGSEHRLLSDKIIYIYNFTLCQFRSGTVQISILLGSSAMSPMN